MKQPYPLYWIALLPLLGAALNLLIGRKLSRRGVHVIACGAVLGSLAATLVAVFRDFYPLWVEAQRAAQAGQPLGNPALVNELFTWIAAGTLQIKLTLVADALTAVMLIVITFVGFLIHVYSTGYMADEADYARFFGYLNLFTGAMLLLVLGDSLPVLFIGWEGVGLCSYLLIGFWYDKSGVTELGDANASAGRKAFIVNRIGDFAFLLGMLVLFYAAGTLSFEELASKADRLTVTWNLWGKHVSVAGLAGLLLVIGATGKSAQIPLYIWLPDAMAGPTPVSALIHAATMVTAGVYMVVRLNFLYVLTPPVMGVIALIGAATALFAATIGCAQNDIKKVLAYSTVSQLGYMFVGVGVGAFAPAVFHLFTHAFFKACLFLGAGAVIHALHHEQDIRAMGGLRKRLPLIHHTFLISTAAIAGLPLLSGFFSKDEILWKAISTGNAWGGSWLPMAVYVMALSAALCTAFYMFRLYYLTFAGDTVRGGAHVHVPGVAMSTPLVVLAFGAAVLGFLNWPKLLGTWAPWGAEQFSFWLSPVTDQGARMVAANAAHFARANLTPLAENAYAHSHALEWGLLLGSVAVAIAGLVIARNRYREWRAPEGQPGGLVKVLENKYYVDEAFQFVFVKPFRALCWVFFKVADRVAIDIVGVNGSAVIVDGVGRIARRLQNGQVQAYLAALIAGFALMLYAVGRPPTQFVVRGAGGLVRAGHVVTFDASRKEAIESRELEYRWDFDSDGKWDEPKVAPTEKKPQYSPTATTPYTFAKPGKYRVTLEVRDRRWQSTSRRTLTVTVVGEGRR